MDGFWTRDSVGGTPTDAVETTALPEEHKTHNPHSWLGRIADL
jgi:hypothetical protein